MRSVVAVYVALAASSQSTLGLTVVSSICDGLDERPVRVVGVAGLFCVPLRPCEGSVNSANNELLACPREGQRDVFGEVELTMDTCCAVVDSVSGALGCILVGAEERKSVCLPSANWPRERNYVRLGRRRTRSRRMQNVADSPSPAGSTGVTPASVVSTYPSVATTIPLAVTTTPLAATTTPLAATTTPLAATTTPLAATTPSTPVTTTLLTPAATTPLTPAATTPVTPAATTPVTPAATTPVTPAATTPVTPAATTPVTPAATTPVTPMATTPLTPIATTPLTPIGPATAPLATPVATPSVPVNSSSVPVVSTSAPFATAPTLAVPVPFLLVPVSTPGTPNSTIDTGANDTSFESSSSSGSGSTSPPPVVTTTPPTLAPLCTAGSDCNGNGGLLLEVTRSISTGSIVNLNDKATGTSINGSLALSPETTLSETNSNSGSADSSDSGLIAGNPATNGSLANLGNSSVESSAGDNVASKSPLPRSPSSESGPSSSPASSSILTPVPIESPWSKGVLQLTPITDDDTDNSVSPPPSTAGGGDLPPVTGANTEEKSNALGLNVILFITVGSVLTVALIFGIFYLRPHRAIIHELLTPEPPRPMDCTGAYPYDQSLELESTGPYDATSTPRGSR